MMRPSSLRRSLTAWFTSLLVATAVLGGATAYILARQEPDAFLDDQLRQLALNLEISAGSAEPVYDPPIDPSDVIPIQIWDETGKLLRARPSYTDLPRQSATGFYDLGTNKGDWRIYTLVTARGTVQVAQQVAVRQELAMNAALPALITLGLLVPLSWLLVRWLVGRLLRPLDEVALQLSARQTESTQPLVMHLVPDEARPLVTAMNQALARASSAFLSQRRFVSDAAHQLRTPLTAMGLQLRNLRQDPSGRAAVVLPDMALALQSMSKLTAQLLMLATAETPSLAIALKRFALSEILTEVVGTVRPLAQSKEITIHVAAPDCLVVLADRDDIVTLLSNLIENAVRYTPPDGSITIMAALQDNQAHIEVVDTGLGLPDDMLCKVFDRFVRSNEESEGTGLGLSIAKAIADRMGARISLRNRSDRSGLIARVDLPVEA
jgi:signal transduction histidine kinase